MYQSYRPGLTKEQTLIQSACKGNVKELTNDLRGRRLDVTDEQQNSLLHLAILSAKPFIEAKNESKILQYTGYISALIYGGANYNMQNKDGKTPLDLAEETGFEQAQRLLTNTKYALTGVQVRTTLAEQAARQSQASGSGFVSREQQRVNDSPSNAPRR